MVAERKEPALRKYCAGSAAACGRMAQRAGVAAAVLIVSLGVARSGLADVPGYPDSIKAYDAREVAMLPRWCIYTQTFRDNVQGGNDPARIKHWYAVLGDTYHHLHHYCFAMMDTNRAMILARTKADRTFYLSDSILEFDYVLHRAPPDFVLLPEILTKKGENLIRLGKISQASAELERAMAMKPDYWPAYEVLATYYKDIGDFGKAREIALKGLSYSPNSRNLKALLEAPTRAPAKSGSSSNATQP